MHSIIDKAIDDSQGERDVHLGTLDQDVAKLCEEIVGLEPATAQQVGQMLTQMVSKLDQLEVIIRERKNSET